jgi:hypothetical protein
MKEEHPPQFECMHFRPKISKDYIEQPFKILNI